MSQISYMWLAGPITGIIVQPIIGIARFVTKIFRSVMGKYCFPRVMPSSNTDPLDSDLHIFRWGRRRPFIVIGAFFTIIGLLGFGFGTSIHRRQTALALTVCPFRIYMMRAKKVKYNKLGERGCYLIRKKHTIYLFNSNRLALDFWSSPSFVLYAVHIFLGTGCCYQLYAGPFANAPH